MIPNPTFHHSLACSLVHTGKVFEEKCKLYTIFTTILTWVRIKQRGVKSPTLAALFKMLSSTDSVVGARPSLSHDIWSVFQIWLLRVRQQRT